MSIIVKLARLKAKLDQAKGNLEQAKGRLQAKIDALNKEGDAAALEKQVARDKQMRRRKSGSASQPCELITMPARPS